MIFPEDRLECLLEVEGGGGELLECLLSLLPLLVEARFFVLEPEVGERGGEKYFEHRLDRDGSSPPIFPSSPCGGDFDDLLVLGD